MTDFLIFVGAVIVWLALVGIVAEIYYQAKRRGWF